jgi:uncharacterized protein involved in exopolysaccharide biosynthesis
MSDMSEPAQISASSSSVSEADEISLLDLLLVVVENLRLLVLGSLTAGLIALGITYLIPPTFTAMTKIMPPQQQQSSTAALIQSLGALGGISGAASGIKNPSDQMVAFMQSRTIQDALIKRFQLIERYRVEFYDDARKVLTQNTRFSTGKDGLITITVDDQSPIFAAELANAHITQLTALLSRLAVTEAQQRRIFFEKQLTTAKENLTRAEQALQTTGVNAGALKANPVAAMGGMSQLQAGIAAQEVKVAAMRGYLAESAPDFKQATTELYALRAQLRRAEQTQSPMQAGDNDYIAKYRDFKYHETLFDLFAKQYELARVDESREGALIQILDTALPPERKSKPKKALAAILATLVAGFALLLFVFLRHALHKIEAHQASSDELKQLRRSWRRALGQAIQ